MFRASDQSKLLKYLSKQNDKKVATKPAQVVKPKPANVTKAEKPTFDKKANLKENKQESKNSVDKPKEQKKEPNELKKKQIPSLESEPGKGLSNNAKRKRQQTNERPDIVTEKADDVTPNKKAKTKVEPPTSEKKNLPQEQNNKKKKRNRNKFKQNDDLNDQNNNRKNANETPEKPTPKVKSEKQIQKKIQLDEKDKAISAEVEKMLAVFKKEVENSQETLDDIEAEIRDNEGFVSDNDDDQSTASNNEKNQEEDEEDEMVKKAKHRLAGSMFRSLNEYLYTHPSTEARTYFTEDKFKMYHDAYNQIMKDWPLKPVDYLIDILKKKVGKKPIVIADVGCGSQPRIADAFEGEEKVEVHSFDLYQKDLTDSRIMCADMCRLPIDSAICDFAVYSLSLMPTNLRDAFKEANRILKPEGRMLIVEVASRFANFQSSVGRVQNLPEKHTGERFAREMKHFGFSLIDHADLPPNGYFAYFAFKKSDSVENTPKSKLPEVTLKACAYKPR